MKENARHGFWNGSLPPIGYRIVEAAEQPGHRTKKTLVRLIFRLAREADGSSGPMGVKSIVAKHLKPPASLPAMGDAGVTAPSTRC